MVVYLKGAVFRGELPVTHGELRQQDETFVPHVLAITKHSHMSASILVLDHPYFAVPDAEGGFEIRGVPPGQYTVVGWHERIGERATEARVEAGRPTTVNMSLPVGEAP